MIAVFKQNIRHVRGDVELEHREIMRLGGFPGTGHVSIGEKLQGTIMKFATDHVTDGFAAADFEQSAVMLLGISFFRVGKTIGSGELAHEFMPDAAKQIRIPQNSQNSRHDIELNHLNVQKKQQKVDSNNKNNSRNKVHWMPLEIVSRAPANAFN